MSDKLVDIFIDTLPSVPLTTAEAFATGMHAYYNAFKAKRESDMNYHCAPSYHSEFSNVMVMEQHDLWVHSPQFRKIFGLSINELFKTKITMFSPQSSIDATYSVVFVDTYFNRWSVSIVQSECDPTKLNLCVRFPVSGTKVQPFMKLSEQKISDPAFNNSMIHLFVQKTDEWYDEK